MMLSTKLLEAAGNAATTPVYVEDVFSTYLYTGNGSSQVIENGIALGDNALATASNTTASSIRSGSAYEQFFSTTGNYGVFAGYSAGEYLRVDFGAPTSVSSVTYKNAVSSPWAPTSVLVQYSSDNVSWATAATYSDDGGTAIQTISVAAGTGRYWRLYQNSSTRASSSGYEWHFSHFSMVGTSAGVGKGGLVWVKGRNETYYHRLASSPGPTLPNYLASNATDAASSGNGNISAFSTSGFTANNNGGTGGTNSSGINYASWTFRKQPKFFDVVTWTGTGSTQTISHNLGSAPGCIIVKRTDAVSNWRVYHRGLSLPNESWMHLNTTDASFTSGGTNIWNVTSTTFQADTYLGLSTSGATYVAYLFAHDAGGFGLSGSENVISCGSWSTTLVGGRYDAIIDLGWDPQWVMFKPTNNTGSWQIYDNMRGWTSNSAGSNVSQRLYPNLTNAEDTDTNTQIQYDGIGKIRLAVGASGYSGIYVAIRRGPMKVPTSGTSVFSPQVQTPTGSTSYVMAGSSGFPIDWLPTKQKNTVVDWYQTSRLTNNYMSPNTTAAEGAYTYGFDLMQGVSAQWSTNSTVSYAFRRAPSFFDVVCYTGTGSARTVTHNLGVAPEMMIVKVRDSATDWAVYHSGIGATKRLILNLTDTPYTSATAGWNDTAPTASVFTVGTNVNVNGNGYLYVAYLFATCPGVSKVGSYTGTGSSLTIDCGFTSGARFVMIKCTTQAYDWMVFDTARGINSATEPFLVINSNKAQNTISSGSIYDLDWIDPHSTGFTLPNNYSYVNASGETYIYLAIA